MAEYIERKAVYAVIKRLKGPTRSPAQNQMIQRAMIDVAGIPAVDVAPVVRCVNCIHYGAEASAFDAWTPFCLKHKVTTFPDDFCSYGERRGGE